MTHIRRLCQSNVREGVRDTYKRVRDTYKQVRDTYKKKALSKQVRDTSITNLLHIRRRLCQSRFMTHKYHEPALTEPSKQVRDTYGS